jgi:predicted amidohydrolase
MTSQPPASDEDSLRPLRVAAAQAESVSGDVTTNIATAVDVVGSAGEQGARVVVLPELFLTGYDPDAWGKDPESLVSVDDSRLEPLAAAARAYGIVVVAGAAVRRSDNGTTLSLLVFDAAGEVTAPYDKQHLFAHEQEFFTAGDHGASIVVDGWELGLGICYDGCFPAHAAAAAADGALAYLCPSAYYVGSEHRRDLYYAARALDNGMYVVFSGLAGRCGSYEFNGGSAVYDPEGRPVERIAMQAPAFAIADLEARAISRVREINPLGRDRLDSLGERTRQVTATR